MTQEADRVDCVVIGAGVVGLAVARERDGAELGWPFDERSLAAFLQGG